MTSEFVTTFCLYVSQLFRLCGCVLVCFLISCGNASTTLGPDIIGPDDDPLSTGVMILRINHHKQECSGAAVQPCMLVKEEDDVEWNYFYDGIEGFEYEWGFLYRIEVLVSRVEDPPQDGSSRRYVLKNVIGKVKVEPDMHFEYISFHAPEQITRVSNDEYSLFFWGEKLFRCDPEDCAALDSLLEQEHSIFFEFAHSTNDALRLSRLLCSDVAGSFRESCL